MEMEMEAKRWMPRKRMMRGMASRNNIKEYDLITVFKTFSLKILDLDSNIFDEKINAIRKKKNHPFSFDTEKYIQKMKLARQRKIKKEVDLILRRSIMNVDKALHDLEEKLTKESIEKHVSVCIGFNFQ